MEIKTYSVSNNVRPGIQFHGVSRNTLDRVCFFWSPVYRGKPEYFGKWDGRRWVELPIGRISADRRRTLEVFWVDRAAVQAKEVQARFAQIEGKKEQARADKAVRVAKKQAKTKGAGDSGTT